jgi:FkbM family methyltransferase
MPVKGITRYQRLVNNIANWHEYAFRKGERKQRSLRFTTKPFPIHFEVPDRLYQVFKEIFMEDFYDIDRLVKKLPTEPVIIDVGANAGLFDVLIYSKIKKPIVFAYEPMPANVEVFQKTINDNERLSAIHLYQAAVTGTEKDFIDLYTEDTEANTVVSSVFSDFNGANSKKLQVPAKSLSSIIAEHQLERVDLLKLDCEGSEYEILYNTSESVLQNVRVMVIEVHHIDDERCNLASLATYLRNAGYANKILPVQDGNYYMMAERVVR